MPAQGVWLWLLKVVLYQVVLAILLGILIGTGARYLLKYSQKHKYIDKESLLSFSIALALAILGSLSLLGVDDILGAFTAGLALSWDSWINTHIEESRIQEVIDSLLNFTYFIFFGTLIPWAAFQVDIASIQNLVMFSLWILFLRRLPATVLLSPFIPVLKTRKEIFFFGVLEN